MKILGRSEEWLRAHAHLMEPPLPPSDSADLRHTEELKAAGFQPQWSVDKARAMQRMGCVMPCSRADSGAVWAYARAAWREDGLARWAHEDDVRVYGLLSDASFGKDEPGKAVDVLVAHLAPRARLSPEQRDALEAVLRLNGGASALRFLESMETTW